MAVNSTVEGRNQYQAYSTASSPGSTGLTTSSGVTNSPNSSVSGAGASANAAVAKGPIQRKPLPWNYIPQPPAYPQGATLYGDVDIINTWNRAARGGWRAVVGITELNDAVGRLSSYLPKLDRFSRTLESRTTKADAQLAIFQNGLKNANQATQGRLEGEVYQAESVIGTLETMDSQAWFAYSAGWWALNHTNPVHW